MRAVAPLNSQQKRTAGGARTTGTWIEVFGELAPEAFSAWHIARYVDAVAAAGNLQDVTKSFTVYCYVAPGGV